MSENRQAQHEQHESSPKFLFGFTRLILNLQNRQQASLSATVNGHKTPVERDLTRNIIHLLL